MHDNSKSSAVCQRHNLYACPAWLSTSQPFFRHHPGAVHEALATIKVIICKQSIPSDHSSSGAYNATACRLPYLGDTGMLTY